jgi:hypothetical protein
MKCYKVLRVGSDQTLTSVNGYWPTELCYPRREAIKPKIEHSKLFVFDTLEHAKDAGYGRQIWECEVENPHKIKNIIDNAHYRLDMVSCIKAFWKGKKQRKAVRGVSLMNAPAGTIVCDSLKLTKFITMV